ncbi:MAG: hypothetical protein ACRDT4_26185, partial [Micromonosporaceae bacterium]
PGTDPGVPAGGGVGGPPADGTGPGGSAPGAGSPVTRGMGLPPLGMIPKLLLLAALAFAAAVGWALQRAGSVMLAGISSCEHGLISGVPDLRKGQ